MIDEDDDAEEVEELERVDVTREGYVSIWVGPVINADQMAALFEAPESEADAVCDFARAFGLHSFDADFLEICFEEGVTDFGELLNGASFAKSFVEPATAAARDLGCQRANAAVLLFDAEYTPTHHPSGYPLMFLGAYPYDANAE